MDILFSVLISFAVVIAGFYLALRQYFIQREHEHFRRRYLEEGLDALASQIEEALQVFRHNWSNGLTVLKQFRDLGVHTDPDICHDRFLEIAPTTFKILPSYRVHSLVQDQDRIIWRIQQSVFVLVKTSTDFFTSDICSLIRVFLENDGNMPDTTTQSLGVMITAYMQDIRDFNERAKSYYLLLEEIEKLAEELGNLGRLTKNKIDDFHTNSNVRTSIERLIGAFPELLPAQDTED